MFKLLILSFIFIPLIEIYLLIEIGSHIGTIFTIALILLTAIVGSTILHYQGLHIIVQIRQEITRGQIPAIALLEGVILCIAGALLLTPGFFTDIIGFMFLIPMIRYYLAYIIAQKIIAGQLQVVQRTTHGSSKQDERTVLEGEFREHK